MLLEDYKLPGQVQGCVFLKETVATKVLASPPACYDPGLILQEK